MLAFGIQTLATSFGQLQQLWIAKISPYFLCPQSGRNQHFDVTRAFSLVRPLVSAGRASILPLGHAR